MRILLIDADSTIPNIALCKLNNYYKKKGASIAFKKLNLPYYPNRVKKKYVIDTRKYDKVFCSVIFANNLKNIKGKAIQFGGTGSDNIAKKLPGYIEKLKPDYSIYPNNDISYGFLTRGCIRKCTFCKVPEKEGFIHTVNEIGNIIQHNKIKFLDNNILASPDHKTILRKLVDYGCNIKSCFNQGLDIRLLDEENSQLLAQMNYLGAYVFAFDDWQYLKIIKSKLPLLEWRKDWQLKFFVYVHPDMQLTNTINRINWLRKKKILPYIMRDLSCWGSKHSALFIDLAAWCNQPALFKNLTFKEFIQKRHIKNKARQTESLSKFYA